MVKNVSNQKENTKLSGGFNNLLNGVLKFMLILLLIFVGIWIYRFTEPKVKLDDKTNKKIVELEESNKRIEGNQKLLEEKIDKYFLEINEIDKNIKDINSKKEIVRRFYYEKVISIDTFNMAAIDSFFTSRYRFNSN
jgi:septal ring factor EnvC (AmiA/AmiB activator)